MISDQYPKFYKSLEIYTGYFDESRYYVRYYDTMIILLSRQHNERLLYFDLLVL